MLRYLSMRMVFITCWVFLLSFGAEIKAQSVSHVAIGINGLHCSACTFSVEKSLRKLDFISVVLMDLNDRSGLVYFKPDANVDYYELAKAVVAAGFSVRSFELILDAPLEEDVFCFEEKICVVDSGEIEGNRLKLLGKGFEERKATSKEVLSTYREKAQLNCKSCAHSNAPILALSS